MIDFPNSPTTGQIFTAAGASWRWDGTKWVAYGGGSSGDVGRNFLHNSLFNISQRTGPWTAAGYTLDRWRIFAASDTISISQFAMNDANRAQIGDEAAAVMLLNTFTGNAAAGAQTVVFQYIEGVRRLAGKTVTVSFYAQPNVVLKLGVSLDQIFGSGGSPSATVQGAGQSVTLSTSWARYTLTFTLPSIAGKTLGTAGDDNTAFNIFYSSGATNATRAGNIGVQSGTIGIWGVQLEIGSVATPLEKPDPQQDFAKCQRFYAANIQVVASGYQSAGAILGATVLLPVTMRAAPTAAFAPIGNVNIGTITPTPLGAYGLYIQGAATATGATTINGGITVSADL